MIQFPKKKYHIIYADPPWTYIDKKKSGRTGFGAENYYSCMSMKEIKSLPIQDISEDNAVLFLWVTFPLLKECLDIFEAWGFKYKTLGFSWIKLNKNTNKPWFGIGTYCKTNCEICLMGTKGKVGRLIKDKITKNIIFTDPKNKLSVKSNFISSALLKYRKKHSEKPDAIRTRIVKLFGDISRIELFARKKYRGWDTWGDEV